MVLGFEITILALIFLIVFLGGFVKGAAGFGYGVASTAVLTTLLEPSVAVVVMILPVLGANLSLITELDSKGLQSCVRRFRYYVLAALIGTVVGMALLDVIPKPVVAFTLGIFVLGYVLFKQERFLLPGKERLKSICFTPSNASKVGFGFVSGAVFGASNIGIQIVAYLDSLSLDRSTFVGVLAMILVGVSTIRVGLAWALGLYGSGSLLPLSVIATFPGLVGVSVGTRVRNLLPQRYYETGVLILLVIVGVRLTYVGGINI
ncbi:MAG: sulfite exporter TauE/SafE family protein [Halobacteria archaeon]|nr:sulfite exporter TauE/SafE family protein [Halobacteria archaeon]